MEEKFVEIKKEDLPSLSLDLVHPLISITSLSSLICLST